jgi:hypothetical protein
MIWFSLAIRFLLCRKHLADFVLADVVNAHRQVAVRQALGDVQGFAHRSGDAARDEPGEDHRQERSDGRQYESGCVSVWSANCVGFLAGLGHQVGLEVDQVDGGFHVVVLHLCAARPCISAAAVRRFLPVLQPVR